MKKSLLSLTAVALIAGVAVGTLAGCGGGDVELKYHYYHSELDELGDLIEQDYNHDLVYQNDLKTLGADPSAIYITEGEDAGYYYMYDTSDPINATGYLCYRSKNLNDWECMGVAYNPTLYIEKGITYSSFAIATYWAPEVIYDADMGLYLMFYNAAYMYKGLHFFIDVAVSKSPKGPFVQYAKWMYNENENATPEQQKEWEPVVDNEAAKRAGLGEGKLKVFMPLLDFSKIPDGTEIDESWQKGDAIDKGELPGYMKVIDASPFIDENGEKYLYFVQDLGGNHNTSAICVVKMNKDWSPDYTQLKKLTVTNQSTIDSARTELYEGNTNEAPFMAKHDGKYYLMFSANSYTQTTYQVRVAVGDSPMGPFRKLARNEGGWLLYREGDWMSGTGHHSFVNAKGTTFIVYHAHTDRRLGGGARAIAFDEIRWIDNGQGLVVPYANGPTYSHMPVLTTEWKNIAPEAKITSTNTADGSDVKYLNDGLIKIHNDLSVVREYVMDTGSVEITLNFDDYREITALFIANASSYELSVWRISKIEFEFKDGSFKGTAYTGALDYDYDRYYPGEEYYVTGGTFAIEFKPMLVKSIKITLPNSADEMRALSEIIVLGK